MLVQRVLYLVIFRACAHQTSAMAATVRLATRLDVPLINALVYELAEVEEMRSSCKSTDIGLNELLFTHAPFQGPTVFILEIEEPTKEAASQNQRRRSYVWYRCDKSLVRHIRGDCERTSCQHQ